MPHPFVAKPIGQPFIELQSVDSTNNYALGRVHAGLAQDGMAVFAHRQVAGKGQWGRVWTTGESSDIILSVLLKPDPLQLSQQFQLSACSAVAVHHFFMNYAGEDTRIKWPNDLYWQDRKAGGILIESVVGSRAVTNTGSLTGSYRGTGSHWQWAVIGIGININQTRFPVELLNPVSLKQITGKTFDAVFLAKELCSCLEKYFSQLISEGFEPVFNQYLSHLYKRDEKVKLKKSNRIFEATIKTISPSGQLVVQHGSMEEVFNFGEVEWII